VRGSNGKKGKKGEAIFSTLVTVGRREVGGNNRERGRGAIIQICNPFTSFNLQTRGNQEKKEKKKKASALAITLNPTYLLPSVGIRRHLHGRRGRKKDLREERKRGGGERKGREPHDRLGRLQLQLCLLPTDVRTVAQIKGEKGMFEKKKKRGRNQRKHVAGRSCAFPCKAKRRRRHVRRRKKKEGKKKGRPATLVSGCFPLRATQVHHRAGEERKTEEKKKKRNGIERSQRTSASGLAHDFRLPHHVISSTERGEEAFADQSVASSISPYPSGRKGKRKKKKRRRQARNDRRPTVRHPNPCLFGGGGGGRMKGSMPEKKEGKEKKKEEGKRDRSKASSTVLSLAVLHSSAGFAGKKGGRNSGRVRERGGKKEGRRGPWRWNSHFLFCNLPLTILCLKSR